MKKTIIAFGVSASCMLALFIPSGCYYDNEEDLYGTVTCDTTALSYKNDIVPILNIYCYACHVPNSGQAGATEFDTYSGLQPLVQNVVLRMEDPFSPMPPTTSPQPSACDIAKIKAWVNAGALDN